MSIIIKWNPMRNIFVLDEALNQMADHVSEVFRRRRPETSSAWVPIADMYETKDALLIHTELAGVEKHSLEIFFQDNSLLIRGKRPFSQQMRSAKIHRIERMYGMFQRSFWIPVAVDSHTISASYDQGVLHITLPKLHHHEHDRVDVPITFK